MCIQQTIPACNAAPGTGPWLCLVGTGQQTVEPGRGCNHSATIDSETRVQGEPPNRLFALTWQLRVGGANMRSTTDGGSRSRIETELTELIAALKRMVQEIEERLDERAKARTGAVPAPEPERNPK